MYDDVQVGGFIIDMEGISMERVDENKAIVEWGSNSTYEEPYIFKHDFGPRIDLVSSRHLIGFRSYTGSDCHQKLVNSVYVLSNF